MKGKSSEFMGSFLVPTGSKSGSASIKMAVYFSPLPELQIVLPTHV